MGGLYYLIRSCRPGQWYKNLIIFLPIIFSQQLFNLLALEKTFIGLVCLVLVSSSNYIINDILDKKRDKFHPEKSLRPIASEKVKVSSAIFLALMLFAGSLLIAFFYLTIYFLYLILSLFFLTFAYSLRFKHELFLDILIVAVNFIIRTISGVFVLLKDNGPWVKISPWLVLCPFFLSLFLSIGKRESELVFLEKDGTLHREVLSKYSLKLTNALMIITTTGLMMSYALYSFLSIYPALIWTLPIVIYAIFRYLYFIYAGSRIAMYPERVYKDYRFLIALGLYILLVFYLLYLR